MNRVSTLSVRHPLAQTVVCGRETQTTAATRPPSQPSHRRPTKSRPRAISPLKTGAWNLADHSLTPNTRYEPTMSQYTRAGLACRGSSLNRGCNQSPVSDMTLAAPA